MNMIAIARRRKKKRANAISNDVIIELETVKLETITSFFLQQITLNFLINWL